MSDKIDAALKSTSVVVLSDDKVTGMLFRNVGFSNVEVHKIDLETALPSITGDRCDLLILETVFDDEPTTKIIRSVREGDIGENIFLPIICLISAHDEEAINASIKAGADDIVIKPLSVKLIHDRIGGFLNRKVEYSVTSDYIGPNRRPTARGGFAKDGLIEVPNTLKAKSEGKVEAATELKAAVSKARVDINDVRVTAHGDKIAVLISRLIAEPQNFNSVVQDIKEVADDFTVRLVNTEYAHIGEMCTILNKVVNDVKGVADKRNVELLILVGQAISLSFEEDSNSKMRALELVQLIQEKL